MKRLICGVIIGLILGLLISAIINKLLPEFSIEDSVLYFIDKLWPIVITLLATLLITQGLIIEERKPKLEMESEGVKSFLWGQKSFYAWRIKIQHIKIPWYLSFIKSRDAALECEAVLTFYDSNDKLLYIMKGRWAETPQPSLISPSNQMEKINYPDTKNITYDRAQPLDCIVKFDDDPNKAYCWNNEFYLNNGKKYELKIGAYCVAVTLTGQNFRQFTRKFNITIAKRWEDTFLTVAEK